MEVDLESDLDLVHAARVQLAFLQKIDKHRNLYQEDLARVAVYRYEVFWLPLKARHQNVKILPPLDIYWVWHVHMLSPLNYIEDCNRIAKLLVDHEYSQNEKAESLAREKAAKIWKREYPREQFEINIDAEWTRAHVPVYTSQLCYDIVQAIMRQRVFCYQVALPHYKDRQFLKTAVDRYKKYLYLKSRNTDTFLVPCYDFDLIWHAHQVHPGMYAKDTVALLGKVMNHDDSVNERATGSRLLVAESLTRELWEETFQETFTAPGAMFRGEPPCGLIKPESPDQIMASCTNTLVVRLTELTVDKYVGNKSNLRLSVYRLDSNMKPNKTLKVLTKKGAPLHWASTRGYGLKEFYFDTSLHTHLRFSLEESQGCCCAAQVTELCHVDTPFPDGPRVPASSGKQDITKIMNMSMAGYNETQVASDIQVKMVATSTPGVRGSCKLWLRPESCTVEKDVDADFWGPVPLPVIPKEQKVQCLVGTTRYASCRAMAWQ